MSLAADYHMHTPLCQHATGEPVHYVSDSWDVDNPAKLSEWKKRDPFEVWSVYFERLTMAAESRLFEIIGHADLPKKFCFYPKQDCTPLFERFLKSVKKSDIAIE